MKMFTLPLLAIVLFGCSQKPGSDVGINRAGENGRHLMMFIANRQSKYPGWNNDDAGRKAFADSLNESFYKEVVDSGLITDIPFMLYKKEQKQPGSNLVGFRYDNPYMKTPISIYLTLQAVCNDSIASSLNTNMHYYLKSFSLQSHNTLGLPVMRKDTILCDLGVLNISLGAIQKAE